MAASYRVFIGAPTLQDIRNSSGGTYHWQTVSSGPAPSVPLFTLPPATLEAASRRISLLYQNIIFRDSEEEEEEGGGGEGPADSEYPSASAPELQYDRDDTTAITWAPTAPQAESKLGISFGASRSRLGTQPETQETNSYSYSDASSIARFPAFHFNLHALAPLSSRVSARRGSAKVSVLAAVLEADGPDSVRVKRGADAGRQVALLRLVLGDEAGNVCRLTAWREVAERWGGADPDPARPGVKRGDVVLFENVLASWDADPAKAAADGSAAPLSLTASPHLKSRMEICYRTMPSMPHDTRFRPDLRLGFSDAAVRKVAAVVSWFEGMAGLR